MSTGGHELAESNKSLEDKAQSSNHAFASPNPPVEVPDHENWKPSLRVKFIITTLACTSFIIAVDAMILVPALPSLAQEFNASSVATFWAGTSFLLAHAIFVTFIGALSDIFGRRALLLASISLFTIGTIICCPANDISQLLAGRTVQGIGAGGIQVMTFVIISDIIPLRQRPKFVSFILLAWGIGAGVGPLLGGAIIDNTTWRWLFYLNFPFCAFGLAVAPLTVKLKSQEGLSLKQKVLAVDWLGGGFFTAGTASFLIGITWAGVQFPWKSYQSLLPIVLGLLAVAGTLVYEKYRATRPFLRLSVFSSLSATLVFFITMGHGWMLFTHLYYTPLYYQSVKGVDNILAGVLIMAVNLTLFPAGVLAGVWITRRGTFLPVVRLGLFLTMLGNGMLFLLDDKIPIAASIWVLITHAIGQGCLLTSMNIASQAVTENQDAAYAVTTYMFMRTLGMCLGVAIGGTVFGNALRQALLDRDIPRAEAIAEDFEGFVPILERMSEGPLKDSIIKAYVEGFRGVFYMLVSLNVLCLVMGFFVKHHTLDKKLETMHKLETPGKSPLESSKEGS